MKLLAVRNDRLGDFMLAWPALQTLHLSLPSAELTVLAREYTAPLGALCRGVSHVLCTPGLHGEFARAHALGRLLRPYRFDAAVALFSRFDIALGLVLAHIPLRVAPATKLAQLLYSHRLRQHRSRSVKPEWLYNVELVEFFLSQLGVARIVRATSPYLVFPADGVAEARRELLQSFDEDFTRPLVFLHPGHGGSSPTLPAHAFGSIGQALAKAGAALIVSEGPADEEASAAVVRALGSVPHKVYRSRAGLVEFARHVAAANLFVSGSTGPLHIAGALDVPTVAFYPRHRSASAIRWQTLNTAERQLSFMPPREAEEHDFGAINLEKTIATVEGFFERVAL